MWPFRMRADPEEKTEQAAEDSLLSAMLSDEQITAEQAMNIPAFAGCVNLICDAVSVIPISFIGSKMDERQKSKETNV